MRSILLSIFFLLTISMFAEHDTTYYKEYNDKFIVSLHNSFVKQYDISFNQNMMKDAAQKSPFHYYANANVVSGIEFDYDIFGISFDYKAVPPANENQKGKTDYTDLGLNIGGNKWKLETSYKKYEGFYDANSANYTSPYIIGFTPYYQDPHMSTTCTKAKFIYITKPNKFSYDAAYSCGSRQIKSAFSWIIVGNIYYDQLGTDISFVPLPLRKYYSDYSDFNGLKVVGLSIGGGFSANIVFLHRFFGNITLAVEPESQLRNYHFSSGLSVKRSYISTSGDTRFSFGYNGKRLFWFLSLITDYSNYNSGQVQIKNNFASGETTIGWRFKKKKPEFYKKFEETKIYKML